MGAHAYNPSTREVDAGGPETQGYRQLCKDFKVKDSEPKKKFFLIKSVIWLKSAEIFIWSLHNQYTQAAGLRSGACSGTLLKHGQGPGLIQSPK